MRCSEVDHRAGERVASRIGVGSTGSARAEFGCRNPLSRPTAYAVAPNCLESVR
jgi:hypothetical protein